MKYLKVERRKVSSEDKVDKNKINNQDNIFFYFRYTYVKKRYKDTYPTKLEKEVMRNFIIGI